MGQYEVILALEKLNATKENPASRTQIAVIIQCEPRRVSTLIKRILRHHNSEIKYIEVDRIKAAKMMGTDKVGRRMRFYYLD